MIYRVSTTRKQFDLALLALLPLQPALVEFQLLAFKNVAITSSTLPWARGDAGQKPSSCELVIDLRDSTHLGFQRVHFETTSNRE